MPGPLSELDSILEQCEKERSKQLQRAVLDAEEARYPSPKESSSADDSDSANAGELTPWQKHEQRPKKGSVIERDKYGVRLFSSDPKFYLDICVNSSKKYEGTSVRLSAPPGKKTWRTFTFDFETMEALRREVERGEQKRP
jgi:hypothetical protein